MAGLLLTHRCAQRHGDTLVAQAAALGLAVELVVLPADPEARIDAAALERVDIAFFSTDVMPLHSRQFFSAARKAPKLRWLQLAHTGVDHPVFANLMEAGVRLTTAAGANAAPVALTAFTGLLMLARGFPHWIDARQQGRWDQLRGERSPDDLEGQTLLVIGAGAIGRALAGHARHVGLRTLGMRRRGAAPQADFDEMHSPDALDTLLPRAQWLAIACPLTEATRRLIDARRLALLPRGARLINVARGEIVDEEALIAALDAGHLAGAYLDVFATEPLPPDSPLWRMPQVVMTPHNAGASTGNDARVHAIFLHNLERWARGEALANEVFRNDGAAA